MQFPFRSLSFFVIIAGFALPDRALAFDPAPLCAHPPAPLESPDGAPVACEPTATTAASAPAVAATTGAAPDAATGADGAAALARARRLARGGDPAGAALALRAAIDAEPDVADRLSLEEAEYHMAAGPDRHACAAFDRARQSPQRSVALRGRIGHVRCLLAVGDRRGASELEELRRSYSELPHTPELDLLHARAQEGWGETAGAVALYRRVDLMFPGSAAAASARARLDALRAAGADVREHTALQRVERAERLFRSGPIDMAREELTALRADASIPQTLRQQAARIAARLARHEGSWDEAANLLREAQGLPSLSAEERAEMTERLADLAQAAQSESEDDVARRVRGLTRGQSLERLTTGRLFGVLRVAARGRDVETVDRALRAILARSTIPPGLRLDAAILASGTGDDALVAALLEAPARHPSFRVAASYHRARALERLGRVEEARALFEEVVAADSRQLPFYAMWSRQRLRAMRPAVPPIPTVMLAELCVPDGPFTPPLARGKTGQRPDEAPATAPAPASPPQAPGIATDAAPAPAPRPDPIAEADEAAALLELAGGPPRAVEMSPAEMLAVLEPIARAHGDAFPWLPRAAALLRLGELDGASDEIHEAYLAWTEARGRGAARADLEGVLRGGAPPRMRVAPATWRARRTFPPDARQALARVAAALGDHGMAVRLSGNFRVAGPRPRAFEPFVEAAAARHRVDPELLWAVMRVESIYNPRIISYAGAIGLMQIMPRTGTLIAIGQGREGFTVDQLLDPETNIDMAAWYLRSLLDRFDGRVPLALASYNGGPHNVRRWLRDYSPDMPLDAFLERIPFEQTHRYVRRTMTHYEAYLAQRAAVVPPLDTRLPAMQADRVAF
ncbi:MAG: lytic transglycosylase domain-containing protein [Sandaracinaceae bacterium]|nr:lytic transglycosylase domain-containing protein [Sandaracinaceae bacterium]